MKRAAAWLLVVCLTFQGPAGLIAGNAAVRQYGIGTPSNYSPASSSNTQDVTDEEDDTPEDQLDGDLKMDLASDSDSDYDADLDFESDNTVGSDIPGEVKVEIRSVLPIGEASEWEVFLMREDQIAEDQQDLISVEATDEVGKSASGSCVFPDVEPGSYELLVHDIGGRGYQEYIQEKIQVGSERVTVLLMNDYPQAHGYTGKSLPGVIRMGDINGDGEITSDDMELLVDAIDSGDSVSIDSRCDLNGDGTVDLIDLQYFSRFYQNGASVNAGVTRQAIISPEAITATASNASFSEEALMEIFSGTGEDTVLELRTEKDEPIAADNAIKLDVEIDQDIQDVSVEGFTLVPVTGAGTAIMDGEVTVSYVDPDDGKEKEKAFVIEGGNTLTKSRTLRRSMYRSSETGTAGKTIVIDLGKQVAIKRVTIRVTGTLNSDSKIAQISRVEFLNKMEDRIPEPDMSIPENVKAVAGSESFELSWKRAMNVTGYEVLVSGDVKGGFDTEVFQTDQNLYSVNRIQNKDLINGNTYTVRVQSVNGDWRSGYGKPISVTPMAAEVPAPPEGIVIKTGYQMLNVSWKAMKNTDTYSLFYREAADPAGEYTRIDNIITNSQTILNLKDHTEYEIYLTGHNKIGESAPSNHYMATTDSVDPAVTPNYKLINVPTESGHTAHIEAVNNHGGTTDSEFAIVDNNYVSAWVRDDWDAGCIYPNVNLSPIITLDGSYEMDTVIIVPDQIQPYGYSTASKLFYWPEDGTGPVQAAGTFIKKTSSNQKTYYEFQASEPFTASQVQIRLTTNNGPSRRLSIAEIKLYYYDSLEHDIYGLYADDMHVSLKNDVTQDKIDSLRTRLGQPDDVSGEYHPKKALLEKELDTAESLLRDQALKDIIQVDTHLAANADNHIAFRGGLSTWQPLGVSASAGDTIVVYVGSPSKKPGDNASLRLYATQYHGESSAWKKDLGQLKAGPNEIEIPAITGMDVEQGGALYIEYTGNADKEQYDVRVSGGSHIPRLDISKATDSNAAMELVTAYIEDLEQTVASLEQQHNSLHGDGSWNKDTQKNCILDATDIVTRFSMLSVSSQQILAGLNGAGTEEKARQLYQSLTAFDEMVNLFYQHKGLSDTDSGKNRLPRRRLNIRYHRMFAGAFMYAGGLHIGIEWGSIPGLTKGVPVTATEDGKYLDGRYFGWGISHEIGHEINEGTYAIAEITNNYFSVLAQADDTNGSVRFKYPDVYQKVTSGVKGRSSSVFTQLGLYWQLHLAYDMGGYNYKTYKDSGEQLANLFFARVDSYVRDPNTAPSPGGVPLTVKSDVDNNLMRLSCAAAEKNILPFFERWGMSPDEETKRYAAQFTKETRAIWFVNDEARAYAMEHGAGGSIAGDTTVTTGLTYAANSNEVTIALGNDANDQEAMLGYEILRSERIKDQIVTRPVGFATADETEFVDTISTVNNRVFSYTVIGYDKYLNATAPVDLEPVKVSHGGVIDPAGWTATTNMESAQDPVPDADNPDAGSAVNTAISAVIDGSKATTYTGKTTGNTNPSITLCLNKEETVTGLTYTLEGGGTPIRNYKIEVSQTGTDGSWTKVRTGVFDTAALEGGGSQTVYFNKDSDPRLYAYDTSYVRLVATGQRGVDISVSEIGLLGQTGDNIDFAQTDSIGILSEDYHAGTGENGQESIIPKGSLVYTGTYKGNPAFNVVLLFDEDGTVAGGTDAEGNILAEQMIFAEVPERGDLGEVSSGTWIYYVRPENWAKDQLPKKIRAELYRVDDALTNQGERLVSNTLFVDLPEELPSVTIHSGGQD